MISIPPSPLLSELVETYFGHDFFFCKARHCIIESCEQFSCMYWKLIKTNTVKCSHCWWYCQGSQWVSKWLIEKSTSTLQGAAIEKGIGRAWKEYWWSHSTAFPCLYYISDTYWLQTWRIKIVAEFNCISDEIPIKILEEFC